MTRWLSDDEHGAWRGLRMMTGRLDGELNRRMQEGSGLSMADYHVLVMLTEAADGRCRMFELAQVLDWERSRLSHHLTRMEKRGLVLRQHCDSDRRGAFIVLTSAGRQAIEAAAPAHVDSVRELLFDALSPAQVTSLSSISASVLRRLDAAALPGPERPGESETAKLPG